MILIYSPTSSPRLQYICQFIFREQLGIAYCLTVDSEGFKNHDGPKINYSHERLCDDEIYIPHEQLLFEDDIALQTIECFQHNGYTAFFKTSSGYPFDIFAASFYLISRYEEYLPYTADMYGRYDHTNSLAWKEHFLALPLVNTWILDLAKTIQGAIPSISFSLPSAYYLPTYDIDMAYSFRNKGIIRNIAGFFRSPSLERLHVLAHSRPDPFDSYEWMDELHRKFKLSPIYFFLVASNRGQYDKNISPYSHNMWQLIKRHAKKYRLGLHPSWKSNENISILKKEKKILESAGNTTVTESRQHYIKINLPETYRALIDAGIENDFSMGYGSINGFRASVASSFFWYDIESEKQTSLRIHPFCYMDANSYYEQQLDPEASFEELTGYYNRCKDVHGTCITIFHNNFLGTDKKMQGWKDMYQKFISQIQQ